MAFERVAELAHELDQLERAAKETEDGQLRQDVLDFIKSVCDEAEKAFGDIEPVLSEVSALPSEPTEVQLRDLQHRLGETYSREKFKNVQKICDRLDELGRNFERDIKPRLGPGYVERGSQLFRLLEKHEGDFIYTITSALNDLLTKLAAYEPGADVAALRTGAAETQVDLRRALSELLRIRVGAEALGPGGPAALLKWERAADEVLGRNPWFSGAFYGVVLLSLLGVLTWIAGSLDFPRLVFVVVGALAGLTIVGALQLRNDDRLSEANFLRLIELAFKRLLLPVARMTVKDMGD